MLLLSLVLILAGLLWAVNERLGALELEVQELQWRHTAREGWMRAHQIGLTGMEHRDAVRDDWMRAHQGDLMQRIEARLAAKAPR